jgi:hypothetical protein
MLAKRSILNVVILERFSKEISEKRKKALVLLQVNGNKVVIAPSRGRA